MTNLLVVLSLVVILAIVLVLVGYLLGIIWALWSTGTKLKKLAGGWCRCHCWSGLCSPPCQHLGFDPGAQRHHRRRRRHGRDGRPVGRA